MLKSYGVGGGWWVVVVAWSNLVSAQGPLVLGLGLKGLGPGLDKREIIYFHAYYKNVILCFIRRKRS